jgi:hypothetical protein
MGKKSAAGEELTMTVASDPRAFRFEPRALVAEPKQFGKTSLSLTPAVAVDPDDPRFLAAQLQHRVANSAREAMLARGHSLESYATSMQAPGMAYDRLVRIQRGETLMQLADLVNWAQHFDNVRPLLIDHRTWPDVVDRSSD